MVHPDFDSPIKLFLKTTDLYCLSSFFWLLRDSSKRHFCSLQAKNMRFIKQITYTDNEYQLFHIQIQKKAKGLKEKIIENKFHKFASC